MVAATICFAATVVSFLVWGLIRRRTAKLLAAADYRYCPFCRFDIRGLPQAAQEQRSLDETEFRCPECGSTLTHENVRRLWKETYEPSNWKTAP